MAALFPERCRAIHVNEVMALPAKPGEGPEPNEIEKKGMDRMEDFDKLGSAYMNMQRTTPYTLGTVLSMNPLALIAYLSEKFYRWSSPTTHPSPDEVLTSCLLYWFSGSITSSFWLYYDMDTLSVKGGGDVIQSIGRKVEAPSAVGMGPFELAWGRKYDLAKSLVNSKEWEILEKGGHFLALEVPDVLAKDIDAFYRSEDVKQSLGN